MSWIKNVLGLKVSQDKFAEIVTEKLKEYGEKNSIKYIPKTFSLDVHTQEGAVVGKIFLQNAYIDYCSATKMQRDAVLSQYFRNSEIPGRLLDAMPNILPRIQPKAFFESLFLRAKTDTSQPNPTIANQTFAEHFGISLIWDSDSQVCYLSTEKMNEWSTSFEELLPKAFANLQKITQKPFELRREGLYVSPYCDSHDASRILLLDKILACRVKGRHVAMCPNRDALFITGEEDFEAQKVLIDGVKKALKNARANPPFPLVFDGKQWQLWTPLRSNPNYTDFKRLILDAFNDVYGEQKVLLETLHAKENIDIFVATYKGIQTKKGEVISLSTWTESAHAWLPKTDVITFVRFDGKNYSSLADVKWEDAQLIAGDLIKPLGTYPERYEVTKFPNDVQIFKLKKSKIEF